MPHIISGFLTRHAATGTVESLSNWTELRHGFWFAPWDEIDIDTDVKRDEIPGKVLELGGDLSGEAPCGFVATCYHGGTGWQGAMAWDGKGIAIPWTSEDTSTSTGPARVISAVCRFLGAVKQPEDFDEFDTVGLGAFRSNDAFRRHQKGVGVH